SSSQGCCQLCQDGVRGHWTVKEWCCISATFRRSSSSRFLEKMGSLSRAKKTSTCNAVGYRRHSSRFIPERLLFFRHHPHPTQPIRAHVDPANQVNTVLTDPARF